MFGSGWKKAFDVVSYRISNLVLDLSCLQGNYNRRDQWLLEHFEDVYKRLDKLEKDNKKLQQFLNVKGNKRLVISVTNCKKL